jgi:hypothetical protein
MSEMIYTEGKHGLAKFGAEGIPEIRLPGFFAGILF